MIGESLGSYVILNKLGEGGMGEVYLASHTRLSRMAAIKVLLPQYSSNGELIARFFREARAISLIEHPGIVQILDCDVHASGHAYIVMEYLRGETLGAFLRRQGPLSDVPAALDLIAQIAGALAAVHAKGIVHRDLKPDNVFLTEGPAGRSPVAKILDFGIAKLAVDAGSGVAKTRTGSLIGTPLYMSPEQCRGAGGVDQQSDVYSLGCIFYEMLCGQPPFVDEGFGNLIMAHTTRAPAPPSSIGRTLPPPVEALVLQMLSKAPAERPTVLEIEHRSRAIAAPLPRVDGTIVLAPSEPPPAPAPALYAPDEELPRPRGSASGFASGRQRASASSPRSTTFGQSAGQLGPRSEGPVDLRGGRARWLIAGGLLAACVGVAAFVLSGSGRAPAPAAPIVEANPPAREPLPTEDDPSPTAAEARAAEEAREETVTIDVVGAPPNLTVEIDGRSVELPARLARNREAHVFMFRAPGYREDRMSIDGSRNRTIQLKMERGPKQASRRRGSSSTRSPGSGRAGGDEAAESSGEAKPENTGATPGGKTLPRVITDL